jgi:hypothetical protein
MEIKIENLNKNKYYLVLEMKGSKYEGLYGILALLHFNKQQCNIIYDKLKELGGKHYRRNHDKNFYFTNKSNVIKAKNWLNSFITMKKMEG